MIYATCFVLTCKILFLLSYEQRFSSLSYFAYGLIIIHIIGLFWSLVACLFPLKLRLMGAFICAVPLTIGLYILLSLALNPFTLILWMHKSDYLARVAATPPSMSGRVSLVVFSYTEYLPALGGGYECATEIVYDNSSDAGLIAQSASGRAYFVPAGDNFYIRFPPCG
jgi:hypothetical protein